MNNWAIVFIIIGVIIVGLIVSGVLITNKALSVAPKLIGDTTQSQDTGSNLNL